MRKTFIVLSTLAGVALIAIPMAIPASAQQRQHRQVVVHPYPNTVHPAATTTGVVGGTVLGLGLSQGWWGGSAAAALPASAAGAAVTGGVAGIGAIALIDAATQPCRGFRAIFSPFVMAPGQSGCVNGEYVGYRVSQRDMRSVYR